MQSAAAVAAAPAKKVLSWLAQQPQQNQTQIPPKTKIPIPQPSGTISATPIFNPLGYLR